MLVCEARALALAPQWARRRSKMFCPRSIPNRGVYLAHHYVVRKLCGAGGRPDKFEYHVPDDIWERVVPTALRNRSVRLVCFDDFAAMRRVNYARHLAVSLRFVGDAATFEFEMRRARASASVYTGV